MPKKKADMQGPEGKVSSTDRKNLRLASVFKLSASFELQVQQANFKLGT
jgi:hypothetical protein